MEEKKLNKSKVINVSIAIIVLLILIAVLTRFLTIKKEATNAADRDAESGTNIEATNVQNTEKESVDNSIWPISTGNTIEENAIENTIKDEEENTTNDEIESQNQVEDSNTINNTIEETNTTNTTNTANETANSNTTNDIAENKTTDSETKKENEQKKKDTDVKGVIWLTFDDGPSSNITPKILDILKKENIKATFFVINYSSANEHLVKRAAQEGHTIGIHGYSHEYSKIYKSKETFLDNVYTLQDKIYKTTGIKSMYIRFPGGSSNTVSRRYSKGIMTKLTKEMLSRGFKYFDWNVSSGDAGGAKTAKDVYNNVTKNLSKKRGNMVLMHDFAGNKKGLEALPDIIKYAKKKGYTFAAIDDNTPMYAQHINN